MPPSCQAACAEYDLLVEHCSVVLLALLGAPAAWSQAAAPPLSLVVSFSATASSLRRCPISQYNLLRARATMTLRTSDMQASGLLDSARATFAALNSSRPRPDFETSALQMLPRIVGEGVQQGYGHHCSRARGVSAGTARPENRLNFAPCCHSRAEQLSARVLQVCLIWSASAQLMQASSTESRCRC